MQHMTVMPFRCFLFAVVVVVVMVLHPTPHVNSNFECFLILCAPVGVPALSMAI
jgi:hypothetical protein